MNLDIFLGFFSLLVQLFVAIELQRFSFLDFRENSFMVMLHRCQIPHLKVLLKIDKYITINGLTIPQEEEIAPGFLLELAIDNLSQDPVIDTPIDVVEGFLLQ